MKNLDPCSLIPHLSPALIVTAIEGHDSECIRVLGRIFPEHPLAVGGTAPAILAMEFAAQAGGVLLGLLRLEKDPESTPPKKGYLASLRDVHMEVPTLPVDHSIRAEVILEGRLGSMALFSATVTREGEIVATGRFAIAGEQRKSNREDAQKARK